MDCGSIREKLDYYLEGRLSAEEQSSVRKHLAGCAPCAARLEELGKLKSRIGELEEVEAPPWFEQKIMRAVRGAQDKKSIWKRLFYPLHVKLPVQALATVLVVVLAIQVFRSLEPETKSMSPALSSGTVVRKIERPAAPAPDKEEALARAPQPVPANPPKTKLRTKPETKLETKLEIKKDAAVPPAASELDFAAPLKRKKEQMDMPPPAAPAAEPLIAVPSAPAPLQAARELERAENRQMRGPRADSDVQASGSIGQLREQAPPALARDRAASKAWPAKSGDFKAESPAFISVKVESPSPKKAAEDIRAGLGLLGGSNIVFVPSGETAYLAADIPGEKVEELASKLAGFGTVTGLASSPPGPGPVRVSIHVGPSPPVSEPK